MVEKTSIRTLAELGLGIGAIVREEHIRSAFGPYADLALAHLRASNERDEKITMEQLDDVLLADEEQGRLPKILRENILTDVTGLKLGIELLGSSRTPSDDI